ncbi:hypothetical protein CEXT_611371, partial [Caerostris extrusa]
GLPTSQRRLLCLINTLEFQNRTNFLLFKAQLEELENEKKKRKTGSEDNVASFDYLSEED